MYFLSLLLLVQSSTVDRESLSRVCNVTANLHRKTKFRTLYELFSLGEKAGISEIQKSYRKMVREGKFPDGTPIASTVLAIVNESYDVLRRCKDTYDYLLDHPYLMREPVSVSRVNVAVGVLLAISTLLFADFLGAAARILLHGRGRMPKRSAKKGRRGVAVTPSLSDMNVLRLYRFVSRRRG